MRCKWLHSELDAFERVELIKGLREGEIDVLVGVNLLREGLDLPEVSLVAILDADKEGIEREAAAHEQVSRAAGVNSEEIITLDYLDELEKEMLQAADELDFERAAQLRDRIEAMREKVGQQTTVFQFDLEEKKKRGRRGRRGGDSNRARIPKPER